MDTFELGGPATGGTGAFEDITSLSVSSWASSNDQSLTVTISDPDNVDYDGRYRINHINGKSSESSELLICHIKQPTSTFISSTVQPFTIVKQYLGSLTIELEPYTSTIEAECGSLVYTASVISGYNHFSTSD